LFVDENNMSLIAFLIFIRGLYFLRKIAKNLLEKTGITTANISILKSEKAKAIRFSTLESICKALNCQPVDLLEYSESD